MTDKFKTNKVAKDIKRTNEKRALKVKEKELIESADNLARKLGTEESVEMIKESLPKYKATTEQPKDGDLYIDGYTEGFDDGSYEYKKVCFIGLLVGFTLGILFFHFVLVMPLLNNL